MLPVRDKSIQELGRRLKERQQFLINICIMGLVLWKNRHKVEVPVHL
jgi:hypothetical protein